MGPEADLVEPRLARGSRCFAVIIDGSVAGYGWLSTGPEWIGEIKLEISPRPGEGYIWNCATVAAHRRRGVFRSVIAGISEAARREGLRRLWIGSVAIPAEKAVGPSGFRPALRFAGVNFAGLQALRIQSAGDAALVQDAARVLGVLPGLYVRRYRRRRH